MIINEVFKIIEEMLLNKNYIVIIAIDIDSGGILSYEFWLYKIVLFIDVDSFRACYNCICD